MLLGIGIIVSAAAIGIVVIGIVFGIIIIAAAIGIVIGVAIGVIIAHRWPIRNHLAGVYIAIRQ